MKQLKCEMCGSSDIIKQDGLFVCQSCGVKYSLEEAKKLLVEGMVKIDKTDEIQNLLKRAFMHLEEGKWTDANKILDQILNQEPENAQAYVGKLMLQLRVKNEEEIDQMPISIEGSINYKRIMQFGDEVLKTRFSKYANKENTLGSIGQYHIISSKSELTEEMKQIIIKEPIPEGAFRETDIEKVIILDGVTHIADSAFYECKSLVSVILPNSLMSIGSAAFSGCQSLENITLPNSLTIIGPHAFYCCFKLKTIVIPRSIADIRSMAFYGVDLTGVTVPSSIKKIGADAFTNGLHPNTIRFEGTTASLQSIREKDNSFYSGKATFICTDTEQINEAWKRQCEANRRKANGLCQHCGGSFKLFSAVCKQCGKRKDY